MDDDEQDSRPLLDNADPDATLGGKHARNQLEGRLLRKLDTRMSFLVLIYILNYIDRNNAAAARLHGFERDLGLEGSQFASVLSILYVGYLLMQIPSNSFLIYIGRPSLYLPLCMMTWGVLSMSTGLATNFVGVMYIRFFIGVTEAAFFPELSQRMTLLSCGALIASAILDVKWPGGYAPWRWLFFIEGGMTVIVAFAAIFILPDFPESKASWMSPAEQALARQRMLEDAGAEDLSQPGVLAGLVMAASDWKVWWLALSLTSIVLSLTHRLGSLRPALSFANSRHSDHTGERYWHIACPLLAGCAGFLIAMATLNTAARYLSLFLMASSYAGFITYLAWASGSIRPASKRAISLAGINMISSLGNVVGSYIFPASWGPDYRASYSICTFASVLGLLMSLYFRQHLRRMNSEAERREAELDEPKGYRYLL
ncbi:MFS general substrate transporter [Roridomyces roridus]|uniref:MFS general substrate transporter n=1 Tax=Roridomyces roridus TaxID=1738132 RepID=A0AAD7C497_9AGAR|nr:MFS general substrate transporter [Roridomyces roridus]